ncbi:class I SAM-dependent methyltransferase [Massilia sp. PWRC2]|uniref:class I SAM-dependent methyltransferase n=1 Tax=Massilia sp. PWRC2 TaxID=2804626 RepID=UPI003CF151B6
MITEQSPLYYAKNAAEHDTIYAMPERLDDLEDMKERLAEVLDGHIVLELACGTGYWTEVLAASAASVVAIDINAEMLALARARELPADTVSFRQADAFMLPDDLGEFTAVFIGFWWSHVKRNEQEKFLAQLRARFGKDTLLVLLDDVYVEGVSPTVARTDLEGNTFKIETAPDGGRYEIPKTYPSDSSLRKRLAHATREIRITRLAYFWLLSCRLK